MFQYFFLFVMEGGVKERKKFSASYKVFSLKNKTFVIRAVCKSSQQHEGFIFQTKDFCHVISRGDDRNKINTILPLEWTVATRQKSDR